MVGRGQEKEGHSPLAEDVEQYLELRCHVKRMQCGTPLLLRRPADTGQEDLQICTFSVTQDLQTLRWQDQEGTGAVHEAPLASITKIAEECLPPGGRTSEDDAHHALTLTLRQGSGPTSSMGLICASLEDLVSWREGLRFLVGTLPLAAAPALAVPPSPAASASGPAQTLTPAPVAKTSAAPVAPTSPAAAASFASRTQAAAAQTQALPLEDDLRRQLEQERETNERLCRENQVLREAVRKKDARIQELTRDVFNRPVSQVDRCNKTESTSRESDEHLRDREMVLLTRKNARLRRALRAKQETISDLLQLVGRVTREQGTESAVEVGSGSEEEGREGPRGAEAGPTTGPLGAAAGPGPQPRGAASAAGPRGAPGGPGGGRGAPGAAAGPAAAAEGAASAASEGSEPEAVREELRALAGKRPEREQDLEGQRPCSVGAPAIATATGEAPVSGEPQTRAVTARTAAGRPKGSAAALQALALELEILEEKKRAVERLARLLPPSDNEEDEEERPLHLWR